jgi:hypothetical protein
MFESKVIVTRRVHANICECDETIRERIIVSEKERIGILLAGDKVVIGG